jgi:hypothetical protein
MHNEAIYFSSNFFVYFNRKLEDEVIREVAKHMHLSPAVLITQIRTRVEGSGIPEAKALMRSTSALRQALEREKKKVRQLSGTVKNEWMSAEEEEEQDEGNPRLIKIYIFGGGTIQYLLTYR